MTREIYDLFHVIRFFDPAVLGDYEQFNKFFVNRILQNKRLRDLCLLQNQPFGIERKKLSIC